MSNEEIREKVFALIKKELYNDASLLLDRSRSLMGEDEYTGMRIGLDLFFKEQGITIDKGNTPVANDLFDQAYECLQEGKIVEAMGLYEQAIEYDPEHAGIWTEYIICLRRLKRYQKAIISAWRAIELDSKSKESWVNLGNVFLDCHEWNAARNAFEKNQLLGDSKEIVIKNYMALGYQEWINGRFEEALKTYQQAFELDKKNGLALVDIGMVKASLGHLEEGKKIIEKGKKLLKKAKEKNQLKYADYALTQIKKENKLEPFDTIGTSYQHLPDHFISQPPQGKALETEIASSIKRVFVLFKDLSLVLNTPEPWLEEIEEMENGLFTIVFKQLKNPESGELLISVIPNLNQVTIEEYKDELIKIGTMRLEDAVEDTLEIFELQSSNYKGYYFILEDKNYDAQKNDSNDFRYMSQGKALIGPLLVIFSILTNEKDEKTIRQYLQVVETMEIKDS